MVNVEIMKITQNTFNKGQLTAHVKCPFCSKMNKHGLGRETENIDSYLGHRVTSCCNNSKGYVLTKQI